MVRRAPLRAVLAALCAAGCNDVFGLGAVDDQATGGSGGTALTTTTTTSEGGMGGSPDTTSTTSDGGTGGTGGTGGSGATGGAGGMPFAARIVDVGLGAYNTCAVVELAPGQGGDPGQNEVRCWGAWDFGITGAAGQENIGDAMGEAPLPIALVNANPLAVTIGHEHACALLEGGKVRCWGADNHAQLAGSTLSANIDFGPGIEIEQISAGGYFTCALSTTKQIFCWGDNGEGVAGDPVGGFAEEPATIPLWDDPDEEEEVVEIAAGYGFVCARLKNSHIRCWGNNEDGQCGVPPSGTPVSPTDPPGIGKVFSRLAAGRAHICGRTPEQEIFCWGDNAGGQLGAEIATASHVPLEADLVSPALDVTAGELHSCAILDVDGVPTAKCWGAAALGQRGTEDETPAGKTVNSMGSGLEPVHLPASFEPARVFASHHQACALAEDGRLTCWGRNEAGVLGIGVGLGEEWGDEPGEMGEATLFVPIE